MPFQIYEEPEGPSPDSTDNIIPTIETSSEPAFDMSSPMLHATPSAHGLLAPLPAIRRLVTPPKTPAPKLNESFDPSDPETHEWDLINDSNRPPFERTGSVCSSFSDSSVSSVGSSAFSLPNGSCTSPGSVSTNPFDDNDVDEEDKPFFSPQEETGSAKRVKTHNHGVKWTAEMDEHLWMTYMKYVSDPTLTPFKMLPGTAPPLGVCHRVAAKAKRTWVPKRATTPDHLEGMMASSPTREGSPDTIRPTEGSAAREVRQPKWPRSDSATRRRLRFLCKRKPFLACHYQRLLRTRSPSPFQSSSSASHSSESTVMAPAQPQQSPAFSGRDMGLSLATSAAPSLQPEAPIAKLVEGHGDAPHPQLQRSSRPADWFARIGRSQAHQKSASLQSGLGLGYVAPRPATAHALASPFSEGDSKAHLLHSMSNTKSLGRNYFDPGKAAGPSLDSPFKGVHGAPTAPRSLKRRFKADDEKKRVPVQNLFVEQSGSSAPTVRHRGYSMGAVRTSEDFSKLNTPDDDSVMSDAPQGAGQPPKDFVEMRAPNQVYRSAPRRFAEPTPRLGSPFTEMPHRNTFPRSYVPSPGNPQPFQQRLRELAAHHSREAQSAQTDPQSHEPEQPF